MVRRNSIKTAFEGRRGWGQSQSIGNRERHSIASRMDLFETQGGSDAILSPLGACVMATLPSSGSFPTHGCIAKWPNTSAGISIGPRLVLTVILSSLQP